MVSQFRLKENISYLFVLFAILHWAITFFFEDRFFLVKSSYHVAAKLLVLILFWQIVAYILRRYKQDSEYRAYLYYCLFYFVFSFLVLLLIWPGNWIWDDLLVLESCQTNELYVWHHFITRTFFLVALFIFPTPVSVFILQLVCISMIVGYFVFAVSRGLLKKSKLSVLVYIPFCLSPVLIMNNTGLRSTLFAYLVLFFTTYIVFNRWQAKPVKTSRIVFLGFVTSIIITLRGEGLVYLMMGPLLFVCAFWGLTQRKQKAFFILFICCLSFFISGMQNYLQGEKVSAQYKLSFYIDPLGHLVEVAKHDQKTELVSEIDEIVDTQYFTQMQPNRAIFYSDFFRVPYYRASHQKRLFSFYIQLIKQYPREFFFQRVFRLINSFYPQIAKERIGLTELTQAPALYEKMFENSYFSAPFNSQLRTETLDFLDYKKSMPSVQLIANLFVPFFLLLGAIIIALVKKQWVLGLATMTIMSMYIPVFLSAPESFFMYYFSFYLTAYGFLGVIAVYLFVVDKRKPHDD